MTLSFYNIASERRIVRLPFQDNNIPLLLSLMMSEWTEGLDRIRNNELQVGLLMATHCTEITRVSSILSQIEGNSVYRGNGKPACFICGMYLLFSNAPEHKRVTATICGHLYCKDCIFREILIRGRCPICGTPQTVGQLLILCPFSWY